MEKIKLPKFLIAYCDETNEEERLQRLRDAGLTDDQIAKIDLNIPDNVLSTLQSGQRLFTQEDLTKARKTERQRLEGNLKYKKTNQQPPADEDLEEDEEDDHEDVEHISTNKTKQKKPRSGQAIAVDAIDIQAEIAKALVPFQTTIDGYKQTIETMSTELQSEKAKKVADHKDALLAKLPEAAKGLLNGDTIETLDASFAALSSFISATTANAKAQNAAGNLSNRKAVFTAKDGKEFKRMEDLVLPENAQYLVEYKAQFN